MSTEYSSGVTKKFQNQIEGRGAQHCESTKNHYIVCVKMVREFHLNEKNFNVCLLRLPKKTLKDKLQNERYT